MNAFDVLNRWFAFSKYNPDQTRFNLLSSEYAMSRANKRIEKICKDYDPSGAVAVLYAKSVFEAEMKKSKVPLYDVISSHEMWKEYQDAWDTFQSPAVKELEVRFLDTINAILESVTGKKAIGERDLNAEREAVFSGIDHVVESLDRLRFEVYQAGGPVSEMRRFSTSVAVYPTLAQCIMSLERAADGVYLCYIRMGDAADGYFGFFCKSNGAVFSWNERPDESFPGQHLNSRNARWSESKAYDIFPYEAMFSFADYDYKGYSTTHKIDDGKLNFFELGAEVYFPIVLAMLMLAQSVKDKTVTSPLVLIDSLLKVNVSPVSQKLGAASETLAVLSTSAIANRIGEFKVPFSSDDVFHGSMNTYFNRKTQEDESVPYDEVGTFPEQTPQSYAQMLIDLYGKNFQLDSSVILRTSSSLRLLPEMSGEKAPSLSVEFVGSQRRMEMEAYREAREQLADHIHRNMVAEYKEYGGINALNEWMQKAATDQLDVLEKLCVKAYLDADVAHMEPPLHESGRFDKPARKRWASNDSVLLGDKDGIRLHCFPDTSGRCAYEDYSRDNAVVIVGATPAQHWRDGFDTCRHTGDKCSIYFVFEPHDWLSLSRFYKKEPPKLLKGWFDGSISFADAWNVDAGARGVGRPYAGNCLLDATDAVAALEHPLESIAHARGDDYSTGALGVDLGRHFKYRVMLGFSKRGFAQLVKQHKNTAD